MLTWPANMFSGKISDMVSLPGTLANPLLLTRAQALAPSKTPRKRKAEVQSAASGPSDEGSSDTESPDELPLLSPPDEPSAKKDKKQKKNPETKDTKSKSSKGNPAWPLVPYTLGMLVLLYIILQSCRISFLVSTVL